MSAMRKVVVLVLVIAAFLCWLYFMSGQQYEHEEDSGIMAVEAPAFMVDRLVMGRVAVDGDQAGSVVFDRSEFEKDRVVGLRRQADDSGFYWTAPVGFHWFPSPPRLRSGQQAEATNEARRRFEETVITEPWDLDGEWIFEDPELMSELGRGYFNEDDFRSAEVCEQLSRLFDQAWTWKYGVRIFIRENRTRMMENFSRKLKNRSVAIVVEGAVFSVAMFFGTIVDSIEITGSSSLSKSERDQIMSCIRDD